MFGGAAAWLIGCRAKIIANAQRQDENGRFIFAGECRDADLSNFGCGLVSQAAGLGKDGE